MDVQEGSGSEAVDEVGLATTAVRILAPYVATAGGKLAEVVGAETGKRMVVSLWDKIGGKLTRSSAGKEALEDFAKRPEEADHQAALRVQLKKALEADPAFRAELAELVGEIKAEGGDQIIQSADVTGDRNVTTQIAGSGNVVN